MKKYFDAQLVMFVLLALGASILSSHGAFQFFKYLVADWLAWVFILVVALGIIGLDAAGTATQGRARAAYYSGMAFFLVLETLANYFAGQAGFVAQIVAKLPPSSDLRMIAEQSPVVTRVLVVLFLSLASLAVAFFTFAATVRIQQIRAGVEGSIVTRLRALLMQRRALIRRLLAEMNNRSHEFAAKIETLRATSEAERDQLRAQLAQLDASRETLRGDLSKVRAERDQLRVEVDAAMQDSTTVRAEFAATTNERDQLRVEVAELRGERVTLHRQFADLRAETEQVRAQLSEQARQIQEAGAVAQLDVREIAHRLADDGVSFKAIGRALGVSDKTAAKWAAEKVEA